MGKKVLARNPDFQAINDFMALNRESAFRFLNDWDRM